MGKYFGWLVCLLLAVTVFYLFLLFPRRNHPQWDLLRRYRYAHRGLFDNPRIPENSLLAFRRAVEQGYGAELDVHLTRDGRLAVIHDSALRRTCGAEGNVEDYTAEELARFRLEGTEEQIPFLEEVLPLFTNRTPLIVEVKSTKGNYAELTKKTLECLDRFPVHYAVESFNPAVVLWLRIHRPEVVRGQLSENFHRAPFGLNLFNRFAMTNLIYNFGTRPDFIAYRFEDRHGFAPRLCCDWVGGQEVNWTVRSLADMQQAEREGHLVIFEGFIPGVGEERYHEKEQNREKVAEENL